jgi:hypothetical protein
MEKNELLRQKKVSILKKKALSRLKEIILWKRRHF